MFPGSQVVIPETVALSGVVEYAKSFTVAMAYSRHGSLCHQFHDLDAERGIFVLYRIDDDLMWSALDFELQVSLLIHGLIKADVLYIAAFVASWWSL